MDCSNEKARPGLWPKAWGRQGNRGKFLPTASTSRGPHHAHGLLHPLFGLLCGHHARAASSLRAGRLRLHTAPRRPPLGVTGREKRRSGGRNAEGAGHRFRGEPNSRASGSDLWTNQDAPDLRAAAAAARPAQQRAQLPGCNPRPFPLG
jgi:hypothetical protein